MATLPARDATLRATAMPTDTNPAGDIFGGWLMSQMDLAANSAASRYARGRCVTVAVDGIVFHQPVFVGDEVSFYADILSVGKSSMRIRVCTWRRSPDADDGVRVTEAVFTFVRIDNDRRPALIQEARDAWDAAEKASKAAKAD